MNDEPEPLLIRERISVSELPPSLEAYSVYPAGKRPVDRKGRLRPRAVEINGLGTFERFEPPVTIAKDELAWFLKEPERRWRGIETRWGARAKPLVYALAACGGLIVHAELDERYLIKAHKKIRLTPYWAEVAPGKLVELTGKLRPEQARAELLRSIAGFPELACEHARLAIQPLDAPMVPPPGSKAKANAWSPYEFALRVAAWWYQRPDSSRTPTLDEVAACALPERKASKEEWTQPRRQAVENILGGRLSILMKTPDYEIRVRGPLRWRIGSVAADAGVARPWTGLPSNGARLIGDIEFESAKGVFVVENQSTFQEACGIDEIVDDWIVLWGKGYATHGLVDLIKILAPLPIAIWGDLDADGIGIILDMQERVGRPFHPVGMDADYWSQGPHRGMTAGQRDRSAAMATQLALNGPDLYRDLATRIAQDPNLHGASREQQTLHDTVLPLLPGLLSAVLVSPRSAPPAATKP